MQKQIMRRVYYSYLISVAVHPMMWQGIFLGASAILLAKWLHVASIINNFLAVPVGSVPQYLYGSVSNAVNHGELVTVITLFASGFIAVSAGYQLANSIAAKVWWLKKA